jgi:hypothetical protein
MSHVFISYVKENQKDVDRLCSDLIKHGIKVWLDRSEIEPGTLWKDAIRNAIKNGSYFIACFSKEYHTRDKTYMNKELVLAIDELCLYPTNKVWFIPVLLSECEVPARTIGAGLTLLDIQWVPLYSDWDKGIQRIVSVVLSEDKKQLKRSINIRADVLMKRRSIPSSLSNYDSHLKEYNRDVEKLKNIYGEHYDPHIADEETLSVIIDENKSNIKNDKEYKPTGKNYKGIGTIFKGNKFVAKVEYDLSEWQNHAPKRIDGTGAEKLGDKRVIGSVKILEGQHMIDLRNASLSLHFDVTTGYMPIEIRLERDLENDEGHYLVQTSGNGIQKGNLQNVL